MQLLFDAVEFICQRQNLSGVVGAETFDGRVRLHQGRDDLLFGRHDGACDLTQDSLYVFSLR